MVINAIIYFGLYMLLLQVWDSFKKRGQVAQLVKGVRPSHVGWALVMLTTTLIALSVMSWAATSLAPWLQWGWFTALTDQSGSMLSAGSTGRHTVPKPVLVAFYAAFVLAIPLMVLVEERLFRSGAERRSTMALVGMACLFGLAHMVVGVPVFAAVALIPAGLWLTKIYRSAYTRTGSAEMALFEAGRVHLANNMIAVALGALAYMTLTR